MTFEELKPGDVLRSRVNGEEFLVRSIGVDEAGPIAKLVPLRHARPGLAKLMELEIVTSPIDRGGYPLVVTGLEEIQK